MPERAGHGTRDPTDYYATTPELAALVIEAIAPMVRTPASILEPGCGAGVWLDALARTWPEAELRGIEIHEDLAAYSRQRGFSVRTGDLLNNELGDHDLIIGNPPFRHLDDLVPLLLDHLRPNGWLVLLLRLNFLAGQDRYARLWQSRPPAFVLPLPARPGFSPDGSTDATDYAIYLWSATATRQGETRLRHLDNRLIENRWSQGRKEKPDPRFPDPRRPAEHGLGSGLSGARSAPARHG